MNAIVVLDPYLKFEINIYSGETPFQQPQRNHIQIEKFKSSYFI